MSILENEDPLFGIDAVPFLATSFDQSQKLWKASQPIIEKKLAAQGLKLLYVVPWPPQGLYAKKDINAIEDMKGLKCRAYNAGTSRIAELVGAQPVTIQAAEVPQAAATGVMNSFISSGSTGYDSKIWEIADAFLRHPGLAAEEHDLREPEGLRQPRQERAGGGAEGRRRRPRRAAGRWPSKRPSGTRTSSRPRA